MLQEVLWHAGLEELHSHHKVFSHLVAKIKIVGAAWAE